jgi:hypothetical protein
MANYQIDETKPNPGVGISIAPNLLDIIMVRLKVRLRISNPPLS